ncbi:MAG: tRNA pseudouridine(55) synthase TruB [Chloroflexi bacterium]|nr:tRNA pseudouridine(55) synthase TruB [Chloroflexota bacterium]MDA1003184.1 tRNA pseudouridine(55) synthase TruB [Chloroflexota bacterium]MQC27752.1 tRNA pseudouridine(55) synthase TruB [Chloroflexota bacterium]
MILRGFINIDKPRGITSFDVVKRIRRAAHVRRVGHAGTLDPNATGVLPVALGEATRFVDELVAARKRYRGVIVLGVATDTYDVDGAVTAEHDASAVTAAAVSAALARFEGPIAQVPPAYSAVKRGGEPAYRAARRGEPHELAAREVIVHALTIVTIEDAGTPRPRVTVDIECGKGFYVRSLAHDLGVALGVGGQLDELARTAVGPFALADATPLALAERLLAAGRWDTLVQAPDAVLVDRPAILLGRVQAAAVRQGRDIVAMPAPSFRPRARIDSVRAYDPDGEMIAVMTPGATVGAWHPHRVLPRAADASTIDTESHSRT